MTKQDLAPPKNQAAETWGRGDFGLIANMNTISIAPRLVRFAGIRSGEKVLDVGCGTGVTSLPAARTGAAVTGIDITPKLIEEAKENARLAGLTITFQVGDAQDLKFPDASFDVVISQFGHMFAPDHEKTKAEMLRVLKPGGRIVTATWPANGYAGEMFTLFGRYMPPPPGGQPPILWGDPEKVRARWGPGVKDLMFQYHTMSAPTLSPVHDRLKMSRYFGPMVSFLEAMKDRPADVARWEKEYDAMTARYFEDNAVRLDALFTKGTKA